MAVSVNTSGSQSTTPGSEHTLATITSAGGYQLAVDVNALTGTERLEIRIKSKCRTGDTVRVLKRATVGPAPGGWVEPLVTTLVHYSPWHFEVSIVQTNGSSRSIPWAVYDTGADPTENTSGSQTASISTEHTLATVTGAGAYMCMVDANALAGGDTVELRMYGKARSSDTERVMFKTTFGPIPVDEPLIFSPVVLSPHHLKFTLKQTAGTGRAFPWAVYALG